MTSNTWRNAVALAIALIAPLAAGAFGAIFTASAIPTWYAALQKPPWNPPGWVFAPVWTVLYLSMGVAAWLIWQRGEQSPDLATRRSVRIALVTFVVQLALNGLWSPTFFGLQRIGLALAIIVALWAAIVTTIVRFGRLRPLAALLLVPYLLWVTFATVLNANIWQLNR